MPKHHQGLLFIGICILLIGAGLDLTSPSYASEPQQDQERPIRVVTKVVEPFVIKEQDRLTGFSIDLWKEITLLTGIPFELIILISVISGGAVIGVVILLLIIRKRKRI